MAKRKRARRTMTAKQRKYFGPKRKAATSRKRKSNPRRKSAAKRRPAMGYVSGAKRIRRRKLNPRRVSRRRARRSNPRFSLSGITQQFLPSLYGAGGALALDVALGYLPLPEKLKTGYGRHAVRIVGAVGLGWVASKFLRGKAAAIGQGALTVAVYGLLRDVASKTLGDKVKGLGDYEEIEVAGYLDAAPVLGAYMGNGLDAGMGAYMGNYEGDTGSDDALQGMDY